MQPHPFWALSVHTSAELEELLGEPLSARAEIHSWPLSTVELLTMRSGDRWIYKVQGEPTLEAEIIAAAGSPLLPPLRLLQRDERQSAALLPFFGDPTLRDQNPSEQAAVAMGRDLIARFASLPPGLPVYVDISNRAAWGEFAEHTLAMLAALIASGEFSAIPAEDVDFLRAWAASVPVLAQVEGASQLINGDLKAEHIFLTLDGPRVIDWQRPYRAPGEIDLVLLLDSLGIDPRAHVPPAVFGLRWFLHLHWAVEAKTHLLPALPFYDQWSMRAIRAIRSAA